MPRKLKDLVGQEFANLKVLKYAGLKPCGKQMSSCWLCKCKCGKETVVLNNNLKRGTTTSCGCAQKQSAFKANLIDITNQKFGKLTVIKYSHTENKSAYWLCECSCGNMTTVPACSLRSKSTKSCGCGQGWFRSEVPGLWKNSAAYARWKRKDPNNKLRNIISGSIRVMLKNNGSYKRKKSIRNHLPYTIEDLRIHLEKQWESWMNWDNYGGKSNDKRRTWWIDHIKPHSSFNYISMEDEQFKECWALSNLRPLDKIKNIQKGVK